jgi:DNA polymerase
MHLKPDICEACPAFRIGQSYVPGVGPTHPKAILLGQGPGKAEATMGVPFIGPAGAKLDRWLARSTGWRRDEVWIDNTVRCWLPKDRAPLVREVAYCRAHHWGQPLTDRLASRTLDDGTSAILIVPLGAAATKAILGPQAGERWFGSLELINININIEVETPSCS